MSSDYQRLKETELVDSSKSDLSKKNATDNYSKTALLKMKAATTGNDNFSEMVIDLFVQGAEFDRKESEYYTLPKKSNEILMPTHVNGDINILQDHFDSCISATIPDEDAVIK